MCAEPKAMDKAETIFNTARQKNDEAQRLAYLEKACAGDLDLRQRVQELLEFDARVGDFLATPPHGLPIPPASFPVSEGPGTLIGRYKLLQEIGTGGFGVVYMAQQQEPVQRKVALKIIKLGMDTRQVIARFEAERQALALMDHPNIAKVLDAGATDTGRPYFVMELVRGTPITEYCDNNKLTTKDRLVLFADVCRAVQHAHQKGIIHRDIKPTNVMVTLHDGRPLPKVIDFGIAKATQRKLTEKTLYTDYHQFIGTPQYMSPEQATMSDGDVDTRTDIYSLGVLLYELLVGSTPFQPEELREIGYDEICRIIRENDPPTPSRRLSTLAEAATTEVSGHRQAPSAVLQRLLRRDLDWIVMKALEKDRTRRYETANDFTADVQRYLNNEPIEAAQPSIAYRFRKFARRNRVLLTTASLVAAALLMGTVTSAWLAASATIARRNAEDLRYVSDMNRAMHALTDRDLPQVRRLLKAHNPSSDGEDRRGWEWRYLWRACRDKDPTLHHRHIVNAITISPDGSTLVSGDGAGKLNVWDLSSLRLRDSIKAHRSWVWNVEFSPDGTMLASAGADSNVRLWRVDPNSGKLISDGVLEGNGYANWCVTLSHDSRFLASAGGGRKIRLWDLETREQIAELSGGGSVYGLAFQPGGHALAAHCGQQVVVWKLPFDADEKPWVIPGFHNVSWLDVAFSPDGSLLAASWKSNGARIWNVAEKRLVHRLETNVDARSIAFAPDGKTLAIGHGNKIVSIWDSATGKKLGDLYGHSSAICCVRYARDGTLVSSSLDQTVRLWDSGREQTDVQQPEYPQDFHGPLHALSLSRDGRWAAATNGMFATSSLSKVVLWDTMTWRAPHEFDGFTSFAFSHDCGLLAISDLVGGFVRLWDLHGNRFVGQIPGSGPLAFSSDGHLAVVGKNRLELWNARDTRQHVAILRLPDAMRAYSILAMEFSPDGSTMAIADVRGDIALLDSKNRQVLYHAEEAIEMWGHHIAFSTDGHYLVTPSYDHTVKVWDVRDRTLVHRQTLSGHTDSANSAAFSRDGLLAVGCANGQVKLWDSTTWQERATYKFTDSSVNGLSFSPDGSTLIAGSDGVIVQILRAASPEEIIEAERAGDDPLSVD